MLEMIADAGELCACEIEDHFELSQPTISHHLKLLRDAGLIEGEKRGTWVFYRVVPEVLRAVGQSHIFVKAKS
jgi:ArsR family transcriptional regulator